MAEHIDAPREPALRQSPAERLALLARTDVSKLLADFTDAECAALLHDWHFWARGNQLSPPGDWFCWLVLAGRGFGKTRMGVEWVRGLVEGQSPLQAPKTAPSRVALVAQTSADGRDVMVEGESGFLAHCHPAQRPIFEVSRRRLVWPNGVQAYLYSADEPDQLRGPQHGLAWGDELAKWKSGTACWSNLLMGLRLGVHPRVMVTTTPRPMTLLKDLMQNPDTAITRGGTFDNAANLSPVFIQQMKRIYEGTKFGRQELHGELLEDMEGALWQRDMIEGSRRPAPDKLERIVVAVDPPVTSGESADACGIIVAGRCRDGHGYILADKSAQGLSPNGWASRALGAYEAFHCDRMVAEVNNGGDLVETILRQQSPHLAYRAVRASRGKLTRAEPIAALYERGLVHHCTSLPELEDELCSYTGGRADKSPDRMDALVWALTDLLLGPGGEPRIRKV